MLSRIHPYPVIHPPTLPFMITGNVRGYKDTTVTPLAVMNTWKYLKTAVTLVCRQSVMYNTENIVARLSPEIINK